MAQINTIRKNNNEIDVSKVIDKMIEDKEFIVKKIREGKKHELKGKFKFASPL